MGIPFKSIRYPGSGPQVWGINLRRNIKANNVAGGSDADAAVVRRETPFTTWGRRRRSSAWKRRRSR